MNNMDKILMVIAIVIIIASLFLNENQLVPRMILDVIVIALILVSFFTRKK